jgi:predicted transcriptional regulator
MILREVLHAHIPTLTAESTVRDAVDKMDIYQFPALVVVDRNMLPIGVLTEGDVCRQTTTRDSALTLMNEPAHIYASKDPITMSPDTEISDAFHKMISSGLTILPIVEDQRLTGVVLRVDLLQAMMMDAAEGSRL